MPTPQDRWKRENTTSMLIRWMNKGDADIIQKLQEVPSKADYIRNLIRADIEKETKK